MDRYRLKFDATADRGNGPIVLNVNYNDITINKVIMTLKRYHPSDYQTTWSIKNSVAICRTFKDGLRTNNLSKYIEPGKLLEMLEEKKLKDIFRDI